MKISIFCALSTRACHGNSVGATARATTSGPLSPRSHLDVAPWEPCLGELFDLISP
jgi:hypothetical protein